MKSPAMTGRAFQWIENAMVIVPETDMVNAVGRIVVLAAVVACQGGCFQSGDEAASAQNRLNDTGITWGGNYPRGVNDDCSAAIDRERLPEGSTLEGDILAQQDCTRGRDVALNNDGDGAAGFEYRKVSHKGEPLPADAESWHCVLDEITGLLWEVKQPADGVYGNRGLHDADDRFTWYNPDERTNAGAIGDWNARHDQCTGYTAGQPGTYCNIEEWVSRANAAGLCGFKDWRVPTLPELAGLVHFGRTAPAIDNEYFPNTREAFYWSLTPDAKLKERAWAVNFQYGYSAPMPRDNGRHARLVRDWDGGSDDTGAEPEAQ